MTMLQHTVTYAQQRRDREVLGVLGYRSKVFHCQEPSDVVLVMMVIRMVMRMHGPLGFRNIASPTAAAWTVCIDTRTEDRA